MLTGAGKVSRLLLLNATSRGDTLDDVVDAYGGDDLTASSDQDGRGHVAGAGARRGDPPPAGRFTSPTASGCRKTSTLTATPCSTRPCASCQPVRLSSLEPLEAGMMMAMAPGDGHRQRTRRALRCSCADQAAGLRRLFRPCTRRRRRAVRLGRAPRALASRPSAPSPTVPRRVVALDEHAPSGLAAGPPSAIPTATSAQCAAGQFRRHRGHARSRRPGWCRPPRPCSPCRCSTTSIMPASEVAIAELQRRVICYDPCRRRRPPAADAVRPRRRKAVCWSSRPAGSAPAPCQWIKGLAAAGTGSLEDRQSAPAGADATALFASLDDFTARHVGLPLVWRGERWNAIRWPMR